jgi:hypothetical protein
MMDSSNDAVVTVIQKMGWTAIQVFVASVNQSGFKGRKIVFAADVAVDTAVNLRNAGFEVLEYRAGGNVSIERWKLLHDWLEGTKDIRYVISCDFRDVVFQTDPSVWLEQNVISDPAIVQADLIFGASESLPLRRDTQINLPWLRSLYGVDLAWIGDHDILCAGSIAGEAEAISLLARRIFEECRGVWGHDQAALNKLLRTEFKEVTRVPRNKEAFMASLTWHLAPGTQSFKRFRTDESPYLRQDGVVCAVDSYKPFCIVHQYDRDMNWARVIRRKYLGQTVVQPIAPMKSRYGRDGMTIDWFDTHPQDRP